MGDLATATERAGSPFIEFDRATWAALAPNTPLPLQEDEIERLRGLGEPLDLREVSEVYHPLSRLLTLYAAGTQHLRGVTTEFLGEVATTSTPFIIGIAGSVAVGKSTIARLLRTLVSRWPETPRVDLVTTDGFLYPNRILEQRGIMNRKGFPESYDRRALLRFLSAIKSGAAEAHAPYYSHLTYDIVPEREIVVSRPDVLIVEGLNVLQPAMPGHSLAVSDMFDFTIYVDARTSDIANWYEERFLKLQRSAFSHPRSYFRRYADLSETEARTTARTIWGNVNEPNLEFNILPTRSRATLILRKGPDHSVNRISLRKL